MKKFLSTILLVLIPCICFAGAKNNNTAELKSQINKMNLADGEVVFFDLAENSTENSFTADKFYAADLLINISGAFELKSLMSDEQMVDLAKALTVNIKVNPKSEDSRVIVVGNVFGKNKPLVITLKTNPNNINAYIYFTNGYLKDDQIRYSSKYFEVKDQSICFSRIPFDNGSFLGNGRVSVKAITNSQDLSDVDKANLIDTILYNQFPEDDEVAKEIYLELSKKNNLYIMARITKDLNYGLYLCKTGKLVEAVEHFNNIEYKDIEDENTIASLEYIFNNDIPIILNILENM